MGLSLTFSQSHPAISTITSELSRFGPFPSVASMQQHEINLSATEIDSLPLPFFVSAANDLYSSSLLISGNNVFFDTTVIVGSLLWTLNLYFGFDWLLAPVGLDNDFNPATRSTVALGRLLAGRDIEAAAKPIIDNDGERPELGTRIGTGANLAYAIEIDKEKDENGNEKDGKSTDWLEEREAGLKSKAPLPIQITVFAIYLLFGIFVQTILGSDGNSALTAGVFAIIACVYEIGRPVLPTKEEALFDAKLDQAVASFADERILKYGDDVSDSISPVRQDEAVNERELVVAFRRMKGYTSAEVADTQIEMRMRSYGTGRSAAGFIKGIRLLQN